MTTLLDVQAPPANDQKEFKVGTTGWTASDLDDPRIERLWESGHHEIINGVLTEMPAAYFDSGVKLMRLQGELFLHTRMNHISGEFCPECDIIIDEDRVVVADMVWISAADIARFKRTAFEAGRSSIERTRVLIPPTLIIESVSYGHERHDRKTKYDWYAEFGVGHYWIFDTLKRTLDCYDLEKGAYKLAANSVGDGSIAVPLFDGLTISMADIWRD